MNYLLRFDRHLFQDKIIFTAMKSIFQYDASFKNYSNRKKYTFI